MSDHYVRIFKCYFWPEQISYSNESKKKKKVTKVISKVAQQLPPLHNEVDNRMSYSWEQSIPPVLCDPSLSLHKTNTVVSQQVLQVEYHYPKQKLKFH